MIRSMTGFGQAQSEENGHAFHVELRSVNNRYFKSAVRVPEEFAFLEAELENLLRRQLTRGSVTLRLIVRDLSESAAQDVNVAAIQHYIEQLRGVLESQARFTLDLATIAQLPGVCQPHELSETQRARFGGAVLKLTQSAIDELQKMRTVEGRALAEDLRTHCGLVRTHVDAIRLRAPGVVREYRDRLLARVRELIAGSTITLAEADLLREVSVYAERSDIAEELARLSSHLEQFDASIGGSEPAGRKLDFIAQEMLREANTIGSKAGDAEIARRTIEVKGSIDRIKEQVQNVE